MDEETEKDVGPTDGLEDHEVVEIVRKVLLKDGHWKQSELQTITIKAVKPFVKAEGVNWKEHKDIILEALSEVMRSIVNEEPEAEESAGEAEEDDKNDLNDRRMPEWNALPHEIKGRAMSVVWAKSVGAPYWPGIIFPPFNVGGRLRRDGLKHCASKYIVHYFACGASSWDFVPHSLCEDFDPANLGDKGKPMKKGKPLSASEQRKFDEAVAVACAEAAKEDRWERAMSLVDFERAERNEERRAEKRAAKKAASARPAKKPSSNQSASSSSNVQTAVTKAVKSDWQSATEEEEAAEVQADAEAAAEARAKKQESSAKVATEEREKDDDDDDDDDDDGDDEEEEIEFDDEDEDDEVFAPTTKKPKKFSRADNASKKRQREAGKGHDDAAEETPTKKKPTTAGGSSHNDICAPNTLKQESGSSRKQLKKPTFTKEETEARKELERGRLEAMRTGSTASSPGEGEAVWKQRKREDVVARGLGLPDASDSSTFLGKLLGEVGAGVGVAVDDGSSFSSFPEGRAQEELARASKALKALWRFGMTAALLGKHPTLVKLLKALRKKHPDDKIKSMAGTIFDKWLCVYGAATPNPSPPSSSSSSSPPPPPSASLAQEATPLAVAANVVDDVTRSEGNQEIIAQGNADVVPAHDAASLSSSPAAQPTGVATSSENGPLASVRLSSAIQVATSRKDDMETKQKDGTGIEDKLREKVKAALRGKNVTEEKVLVTEAALYQAAASDKTRFKELTRLLAKEITESPETLASLNTGAVDPPDLVAKCSLLSSAP